MKGWIERQAKKGGFPSPDDYVRHVLRQAQVRGSRAEIDAALEDAIDEAPASPMTASDWSGVRRRARARLQRTARTRKSA